MASKEKLTSLFHAVKEGRVSIKNAIQQAFMEKGGAVKKKKGGAVKKYSHGGGVSSGHDLTYKRK